MIEVENEKEAVELAHRDPYVTGGVFERVEVKPFRQVFPE